MCPSPSPKIWTSMWRACSTYFSTNTPASPKLAWHCLQGHQGRAAASAARLALLVRLGSQVHEVTVIPVSPARCLKVLVHIFKVVAGVDPNPPAATCRLQQHWEANLHTWGPCSELQVMGILILSAHCLPVIASHLPHSPCQQVSGTLLWRCTVNVLVATSHSATFQPTLSPSPSQRRQLPPQLRTTGCCQRAQGSQPSLQIHGLCACG